MGILFEKERYKKTRRKAGSFYEALFS